MDSRLEPIDYQWFETNDPAHQQYSTAFSTEFGLYEYDLNNQVLPTSLVSVRQALSHMLDKDYFISTYLPNVAIKADSPVASIPCWNNPALADMYNVGLQKTWPLSDDDEDFEAAIGLLIADLSQYPLILDPDNNPNNDYYIWDWGPQFPSSSYGVKTGHLLVFANSEWAPRVQQGQYFKEACEIALPFWTDALGYGMKIRIDVDLHVVTSAQAYWEVMVNQWYHVYTGAWSFGRDPDILRYYTAPMIPNPNYVMYSNQNYNDAVDDMLTSPTIASAIPHAYQAQQIIMSEAGIIPFFVRAGYKAYLANWRGIVNEVGVGINSWWTFLNAHKLGSPGGDPIRYGWASDLSSMNVISATSPQDWDLLDKIYDPLIAFNPYSTCEDIPYLASGWEIGTWAGGTKTMFTFHVREDVYWQDVPFRSRADITWDGGTQLDGPFTNVPLTPIDVAFSIEYIRDLLGATNSWLVESVDHVGLGLFWDGQAWPWTYPAAGNPPWYTGIPPWQTDYVQWDPTLDQDTITVYLNVLRPWLGLHWVGALPIIPMHIWSQIKQSDSLTVATWNYDIVYGTGPWILYDRVPYNFILMIPFYEGQSYRGITLQRSYFYTAVRPVTSSDEEAYIDGKSIWQYQMITNVDPQQAYTIEYWWDLDFKYWDNTVGEWKTWTGWTPGEHYSAHAQITLNALESVKVWGDVLLPHIPFSNSIIIHDSFHWKYVAPSPVYLLNKVWRSGDYPNVNLGQTNRYWSDSIFDPSEPEVFHVHPGDIAGKPPVPPYLIGGHWAAPYLAADGIVDIRDAAAILSHWAHLLPPAAPTSRPIFWGTHGLLTYEPDIQDDSGWCRRADINNDNVINIADVSLLALDWGKKWPMITITADVQTGVQYPQGTTITFTGTITQPTGLTPYTYKVWMKSGPVGTVSVDVGSWSKMTTSIHPGLTQTFTHTFSIAQTDNLVMIVVEDAAGMMALSSVNTIRIVP